MVDLYKDLIKKINKSRVYLNEPMSKHTSFKIGGPADIFIKVENTYELEYVINSVKEKNIPFEIIGNGSNLLVKDGRNKRRSHKSRF